MAPIALILTTIFIWFFAFQSFLTGHSALLEDALPYIEHVRFFIHNLNLGIYPLWDPTYQFGVPADFFLRRIGSFNPIYILLAIFYKLGVNFHALYLSFLGGYFLLGMLGFYLLATAILKDRKAGFLCMALLLFSSQATRIFDTYILLTFVPLVWFFFFLIQYTINQRKYSFIGLTLTLIILLTTYIPFYFIVIFITFLISILIFYPKKLFEFLGLLFMQIKKTPWLVLICFIALLWSLIPGYLFFQQAKKNWVVFPVRHAESKFVQESNQIQLPQVKVKEAQPVQETTTLNKNIEADIPSKNQLSVRYETVRSWGIEEDILYSAVFSNLKKFKFAILYLPFTALIILTLGWVTGISRIFLFLVSWGLSLFFIMSTYTPLNAYLYEHVFFFKYFRNLHFFLWLALLPILILIIGEQYKALVSLLSENKKKIFLIIILFVHVVWIFLLKSNPHGLISNYITIALSLIFWIAHWQGAFKKLGDIPQMFIVLGLIVIQPIEVYHYLAKNSPLQSENIGYYQRLSNFVPIIDKTEIKDNQILPKINFASEPIKSTFYYTLDWVKDFNDRFVVEKTPYARSTISLYSLVEEVPTNNVDYQKMREWLEVNQDRAFISSDTTLESKLEINNVKNLSGELTFLKGDVNSVELKSNLLQPKFLLYWDAYHPYWKASIDGKPVKLEKANLAFKGLRIPVGQHHIKMQYASTSYYFLHAGLLFLTTLLLLGLLRDIKNNYINKS